MCRTCHKCGWHNLNLCCSSCSGSCRDDLRSKCRSGCNSVCNVVNDVTTALLTGGCSTLQAASTVVSGVAAASADITNGINSISGGSIQGFGLNNASFYMWFANSTDMSKHQASSLFDVQGQATVSITYTLSKKQTTVGFTVSLRTPTDLVEQFAKQLYGDIVGAATQKLYPYTTRSIGGAVAPASPPTPAGTMLSTPSVTPSPVTLSSSFVPSVSASRSPLKTVTKSHTMVPSPYSTVSPSPTISLPSSFGAPTDGPPTLKFLEFKSSATAATCTGTQSISLWPNTATTGFSLTSYAGDISPTLFWDAPSGRCVARFSSACSRGYSDDVSGMSASTIMIMARVNSNSARVLSDKGLDWLLGWWGGCVPWGFRCHEGY